MKKYTPFILLALGVVLVVGVFAYTNSGGSSVTEPTPIADEVAPEIPFDQRPFVSLTPRTDGHWLKLTVMGVNKVTGAASVDYVLEYTTEAGLNQGVPGTVKLSGITTIDRDLLLGSESSGKFRYDEGVSKGMITLKFRDDKGKLLGKLATDFHFQGPDTELTSGDGMFTYKLDKAIKKGYFVTMMTFGVQEGVKGTINKGPYGVFSSETTKLPGKVTLEGSSIMRWGESKWNEVKNGVSPDLGIFVSLQ